MMRTMGSVREEWLLTRTLLPLLPPPRLQNSWWGGQEVQGRV